MQIASRVRLCATAATISGLAAMNAPGCKVSGEGDASGEVSVGDGGRSPSSGGGGAAADDAAGNSLLREELLDEIVSAYCEGLALCCPAQGLAFSSDNCQTVLRSKLQAEFPVDSSASYDGLAGSQCAEQLRAASNECFAQSEQPAVCEGIFTGTSEVGDSCSTTAECVPVDEAEVSCRGATPESSGTCVVMRATARGTLGEACEASCDSEHELGCLSEGESVPVHCYRGDGLRCDSESENCAELGSEGEPCGVDSDCEAELACDADSEVCSALGAIGDDCTSHAECGEHLHCAEAERTCAAGKADGEPCSDDAECAGFCDLLTTQGVGECAAASRRRLIVLCALAGAADQG